MKYLNRSFSVATGWGDAPDPTAKGKWIWDAEQKKLVRYEDYRPPSHALDAPIVTDRWYEGARTLDGVDIGSRRKREEYMRSRGYMDGNDVTPSYIEGVKADRARAEKRERFNDTVEAYKALRDGYRPPPRGTYDG